MVEICNLCLFDIFAYHKHKFSIIRSDNLIFIAWEYSWKGKKERKSQNGSILEDTGSDVAGFALCFVFHAIHRKKKREDVDQEAENFLF